MFIVRRKMDPRMIGQQWAKFLKQQIGLLSSGNQQSTDEAELINNPYYAKYADKLKNAKLNQARPDLDHLGGEERTIKEKLIELESRLEKKESSESSESRSIGKVKRLGDVVKLDLISDLNKDEIKKIWYEYFKCKEHTIFACLDAKHYDRIKANASKYPVFVFLMPVDTSKIEADQLNKNNYQFVLVQFQENQATQSLNAIFTPLAFFHTHKENAPATLILNYYTDIKQDKDIVLMEGKRVFKV